MLSRQTKILILGASGLIGRAIFKCFTKSGYENILTPPHGELNLENLNEVYRYFECNSPKIVILTAGKVGGILDNKENPADFITKNLSIQLNVAKAAHEHKCQKVVFLGSSCMYPKHATQPMRESSLGQGALEPSSLSYAISKIAGLQLGFAYNCQYKIDRFLCVIPNSAFGPGDNFDTFSGHVMSSLIQKFHIAKATNQSIVKLWGTGKPRREFVFSEDIANAILFLLEHNYNTLNEPINIGSGTDISILDLAKLIAKEVGFKGEISWDKSKPDGTPQKLLDTSKINDLGWFPTMKLKAGISKSYEWYKDSIGFVEI